MPRHTAPLTSLPGPEVSVSDLSARFSFQNPLRFLEFYEKQLSRGIVGLRSAEGPTKGTPFRVIVSPPGAVDHIQLEGKVAGVSPRADGSVRLKIAVKLDTGQEAWLGAYLAGLRAMQKAYETDPPEAVEPEPAAVLCNEEILVLATKLEHLSYYELLGVDPTVTVSELQSRYHQLTRVYHPELHPPEAPEPVRRAVGHIFRRMNEAYGVLRDRRRRTRYDAGLVGEQALRLSEADEADVQRIDRRGGGTTQVGEYYWALAREILAAATEGERMRDAMLEAARLIRVARVFEPDNAQFSNALSQLTSQLH